MYARIFGYYITIDNTIYIYIYIYKYLKNRYKITNITRADVFEFIAFIYCDCTGLTNYSIL